MNRTLRVVVSGALLVCVTWHTDWPQLGAAFAHLLVGWWFTAVGLLVVAQLVSARRWQLFAAALGLPRSYAQMTQHYFVGMYFNLMLPTSVGGDVVRAWRLDGGSGRRMASFASVLLDRLSGVTVLVLLATFAWATSPLDLPTWVGWFVWAAAGTMALGLGMLPLFARWSARLWNKWQHVRSGWRALAAPGANTTGLAAPRLLVETTVLSLLVQAASVGIVWLVAAALETPIPARFLCIVVPMVSLLAMAPISVNGMGVREGAMVLFCGAIGIAPEVALSVALLWFAASVVVSLAGGVVYLLGRWPAVDNHFPLDRKKFEDQHGLVDHHSDQRRAGQFKTAA